MENKITIEKIGRRHYVTGNTYSIKDQLRAAGCKWDSDKKAWWTSKSEVAEKFSNVSASRPAEKTCDDLEVIGRATYKGRSYYVVWTGQTKFGFGWKLAFSDGSKTFWAKQENGEPSWINRYEEKRTIGSLRRYAERQQEQRRNRDENNPDTWSYQEKKEYLDMLDQCDEFARCEQLARRWGIRHY